LVVEDIDSWVYTLKRAARRAGASDVVACTNLGEVEEALQRARFDAAIVDIGLDPADDLDAEGVRAIEMIREADGPSTRCVMVTGWQGDRLNLLADLQQRLGVEWAFMKEKYDSHAVIEKITELLEQPARTMGPESSMENLSGGGDVWHFEAQLLSTLKPTDGVRTLYDLIAKLLDQTIPLIAETPEEPLHRLDQGSLVGFYWSRRLATAVAVDLSTASGKDDFHELRPAVKAHFGLGNAFDLLSAVRMRNISGRLWELLDVERERFPG
jgi:CheY-like chemotaxis protein